MAKNGKAPKVEIIAKHNIVRFSRRLKRYCSYGSVVPRPQPMFSARTARPLPYRVGSDLWVPIAQGIYRKNAPVRYF